MIKELPVMVNSDGIGRETKGEGTWGRDREESHGGGAERSLMGEGQRGVSLNQLLYNLFIKLYFFEYFLGHFQSFFPPTRQKLIHQGGQQTV